MLNFIEMFQTHYFTYSTMKNLIITCLLGFMTFPALAQWSNPAPNHAIKINALALPLRTLSGQYEIKIGKKATFATTVNYMALGKIPFKQLVLDWSNDDLGDLLIDQARIGNFSVAPELRFYLSKKGAFHGFYIAPMVKYSKLSLDLPIFYGENEVEAPFEGSIKAFSGGFLIGAQWKIAGPIGLDWWILGASYGSSNGQLSYNQPLNAEAQEEISNELANLDIPMIEFTHEVNDQGAKLLAKGPWAGIKAGLALTIRF
jgi:hypothetical protein